MSLHLVKGNVVTAVMNQEIDYLLNQVNGQDVYGAGIAREIGDKLPRAKQAYHAKIRNFKKLGIEAPYGLVWKESGVIHLLGQREYGRDKRYTNYGALAKGFEGLRYLPFEKPISECVLGIPHGLGCGLGGGDWEVVLELIEHCVVPYWKDVYIYELP